MIPTEIDKKALENFEAHADEFFAYKREEERQIAESREIWKAEEKVREMERQNQQETAKKEQEKTKYMIQDLIGKRLLVKYINGYSSAIDELKVIELSPSGNWVKMMNMHGNKFWKLVSDISIIEVLTDLKEQRPTK